MADKLEAGINPAKITPFDKAVKKLNAAGLQVFDQEGVDFNNEPWIIGGAVEIEDAYLDGVIIGCTELKGPSFGVYQKEGYYFPHIDDMSTEEDKWLVPDEPFESLDEAVDFICQNYQQQVANG